MRFHVGRIASILAVAAVALPAWAQKDPIPTIPFEGAEIFCHVLRSQDLEPVKKIEKSQLDPKFTIVIVFGRPEVLDEISAATGGMGNFCKNGGSLLIATDYLLDKKDVPVRVTGNAVQCDLDDAYRKRRECPMLAPPWRSFGSVAGHPIFRFLAQGIATNRPSQVSVKTGESSLVPLAEFPWADNIPKFSGKVSVYCMAGSTAYSPPEGRSLFIAGHGMFINGMMVQRDNDNFAFAVNAIEWLREAPDGGNRKQALFVVDGKIVSDFNANLYPPPPIPMPTATIINRALRGFMKERLSQYHDEIGVALIAAGTLLLLLYGAKKMLEGRFLPETAVPLFADPQAVTSSAEPLVRQRQHELIGRDQFWETAHSLVREWFRTELDVPADKWIAEGTVELRAGGWSWLPSPVRAKAQYVTRLAYAGAAIKVTRRELIALVQSLSELHAAIEAGRLRLFVDGKRVSIAERRNAHQ